MMNRYFKKNVPFAGEHKVRPYTLMSILLCAFCFIAAGPVVPTDDLTPKSTVKDIGDLNLPYTPVDLDTTDTMTPSEDPYGTMMDTTTDLTEPKEVKIDWSKVPYISSKNPQLPHAPDPVF